MYRINLLPVEYRNYQLAIKRSNRILFVLLIVVSALAVVLATSIAISSIYARQLDTIKESNESIKKQINELNTIKELQSQVTRMVADINQAAGLSPDWGNLIADICNAIPPTVELESIAAGYTGEKDSVTIKGNADVLKDFTAMLEYISKIDGLGEVHFKYSGDQAKPGSLSFQVDIQKLPAEPYGLNLGGAK